MARGYRRATVEDLHGRVPRLLAGMAQHRLRQGDKPRSVNIRTSPAARGTAESTSLTGCTNNRHDSSSRRAKRGRDETARLVEVRGLLRRSWAAVRAPGPGRVPGASAVEDFPGVKV